MACNFAWGWAHDAVMEMGGTAADVSQVDIG